MSYKVVAILAAMMWFAALLLPVRIAPPDLVDYGLELGFAILLYGWSGLLVGQTAWLANVGFWTAFVMLYEDRGASRKVTLAVSVITGLLGLSAFLWNASVDEESASDIVRLHYGPGFYCWLSSVLLISGALGKRGLVA